MTSKTSMKSARGRKPSGGSKAPTPHIGGMETLGTKPVHGKSNVMASSPKKGPSGLGKSGGKKDGSKASEKKSPMAPKLGGGKIAGPHQGKAKKKGY